MPTLTATNTHGPEVVDGSYPATLVAVDEQSPTAKSVSNRPWYLWNFIVHEGSEGGVELSGTSSTNGGPQSKARLWVEALLQRKLAQGEQLDLDSFVPRDCLVIVKHNDRGYPTVVDVLPAPVQATYPVRKPAEAPEDIPF